MDAWGEVVFRSNSVGSGGSKYDADAYAVLIGMDARYRQNWDAGFAVGFTTVEADGEIFADSTDLGDGVSLVASLAYDSDFWRLEASAAFSHYPSADTVRMILDPDLMMGASGRGEFDVNQSFFQVDLSWTEYELDQGFSIVPRAFFSYGKVEEDAYSEAGSAALEAQNKLVRVGKRNAGFTDIGVDLELNWEGRTEHSGLRFPVSAHVGGVHMLNASVSNVSYQQGSMNFLRESAGVGLGLNRLETGVSVGIARGDWSLSLGYEAEYASAYEAHSFFAFLNYGF